MVLVAGLCLRLLPLRFNSLIEPDVYIYSYVANQTLHNGFHISSTFSGVPPQPYGEGKPMVLLPAILALLNGQSVYSTMLWLAPFFSVLGIILAYLLALELSKNRYAALMAAVIYAFLPAALSRGIAGEWRGEVAVPIILGFAMLMFIRWNSRKKLGYALAGSTLALLAYFWWNGGVYAVACIGLLVTEYLAYRLLKPKFSNPINLNRALHLMLLLLVLLAFPFASKFIWGLNPNISVTEQAPMSIMSLLYYYGGWVMFVALAGAIIAAYFGSSDWKFDAPEYAMFCMFVPTLLMQFLEIRWIALFALPVSVYGAYGLYALVKLAKPKLIVLLPAMSFVLVLLIVVLVLLIGFGCVFAWKSAPSANLTPQLFAASEWLGSNTPSNSLVMTLWPDGSVVEGIGHRESYSDSIMAGTGMPGFGRFLLDKAGNFTYLNQALDLSRPDYLLVRKFWLQEVPAIAVESKMSMYTNSTGTNLQELINGSAPFPIVYNNSDVTIYKIN